MSVKAIPKRRCMVCRHDLLKGFFRYKTDPICTACMKNVEAQRTLLKEKYRRMEHEVTEAYKAAQKDMKEAGFLDVPTE